MPTKKTSQPRTRKQCNALPNLKLDPQIFKDPAQRFWQRTVPVMCLWAACLGGYAWFSYGEGVRSWVAMGLPVASLWLIYPRNQIRSTH